MATNIQELDHFDPCILTTCPFCQAHHAGIKEVVSVYKNIIEERIAQYLELETKLFKTEADLLYFKERRRHDRYSLDRYEFEPQERESYEPEYLSAEYQTFVEVL